MAWANEAAKYPDRVKLFVADKLGSLDPFEVVQAVSEIARFLEIPVDRAERLATSTFMRPEHAAEALNQDLLPYSRPGMESWYIDHGPLVEQSGRSLLLVEDALSDQASQFQDRWRFSVCGWAESSNAQLVELAQATLRGMASIPPMKFTIPVKGPEIHKAGKCRPCVFAMRGMCKNTAEMCVYCHMDGHDKTKRASHRVRKQRKQEREARRRTPSPWGHLTQCNTVLDDTIFERDSGQRTPSPWGRRMYQNYYAAP